jgi:Fe-S oxidoreductase
MLWIKMDTIRDEYAFLPGLDYCCGSGAICWFPESRARIREERFEEAAQT